MYCGNLGIKWPNLTKKHKKNGSQHAGSLRVKNGHAGSDRVEKVYTMTKYQKFYVTMKKKIVGNIQ